MLISLLLIAIITAGGFSLSYIIDDDAPLMWRIAVGNVVGCAICGTLGFVLALVAGLNMAVAGLAIAIACAPLVLLLRDDQRRDLNHDWAKAKGKLQGFTGRKLLRFAYYAGFFLLFFFFFDRTMIETPAGIFTGGSQNLGDLPFHLGAIFSFTDGNNFPPENPSFSGARFSYPFVADLLTAIFVRLGASVRDALFVQNVAWAMSLTVILERFVGRLTDNRLAARIAPLLLFFSGGLGFIWFFGDYLAQAKGFFDFINHLPKDYTIGDQFRWGNSLVVLFITQRSLLLGMPLTLIVLGWLWRVFAAESTEKKVTGPFVPPIAVGLVAGLLPLVHLHSLAVLFVVGLFLFILRPERWMTWMLFAIGVAVVAVPELLWSISGSASETKKFFEWHFGWDGGDRNFLWFWLTNTGIFIPLLIAGIYWFVSRPFGVPSDPDEVFTQSRKAAKKKPKSIDEADHSPLTIHHSPLLWFYLPFAFLFVVSNIAKLAPWEWDNIKVLIYWFVGSIPLVALLLSWLWQNRSSGWKVVAAVCLITLVASGALDVWRTVSAQINHKVFDKDAVAIAEQIRSKTEPRSLFLNAPTYNSAVVLTGRRSVMRYPGHLNSHGINYGERESDVKRIYLGGADAQSLMDRYDVEYVMVSPEEHGATSVNDQFFAQFPIVAESGQYRVYKVKR